VPGAEIVLELMSEPSAPPKPVVDGEQKPVRPGLIKSLAEGEYKGLAGEDADTHHVFVVTETDPFGNESKIEVHVAAAGKPWVTAVRPIPSEAEKEMFGDMSMTMRLTQWAEAKELPAATKIEIGEDWTKVDSLMEQLMNGGPGGDPFEEEVDPAPQAPGKALGEGDAALNFTLASLGGGEFTLADHIGKVVVVDFWATWCPPCVAGLPVVSGVTKDLASKGVVFVAVDLDEPAAKVQSFMDKKEWDFPVALDPGGKIATAYGVTGIPHSLVIDKKGVIRHVHIGFGGPEQYEAQLRKELNALIDE
jgi:peroxiredoxin